MEQDRISFRRLLLRVSGRMMEERCGWWPGEEQPDKNEISEVESVRA